MELESKEIRRLREIDKTLQTLRELLPRYEKSYRQAMADRQRVIDEIHALIREKEDLNQGQLLL